VRAILSAPGSRGDVNPMIAIGAALRRAGHEVVISLAEPYAEIAQSVGLSVEAVVSSEKFHELLGNEHVWKPIRGPLAVFRQIARHFLPLHEQVIRKHHLPGQTILVSHPLDLASRIVRDADPTIRQVGVQPQPVILRTYQSPPRLSPWPMELTRPQWALRAAYWLVDQIVIDPIVRGEVNRRRAAWGLGPVRRIYDRWWLAPDRILAMYPAWYAPATIGFCPQLVHCGFPLSDVDGDNFVPPAHRPIAFTSGTAHHHCRRFFERAVEACLKLDRSGLLLSSYADNFPDRLPASIQTMGYASFRRLLPLCSAIVHHGGVGTTSQALAAGIPQVIRPMAFDQFDNAARIERLRCGVSLRRDRNLAEALESVLNPSSRLADRSVISELAQRLASVDAPAAAAQEIEAVWAQAATPAMTRLSP
jgi:rhamnosyltransferase subunit B